MKTPNDHTLYAHYQKSSYEYVNGQEIMIIPYSGYYKFETWGASGGYAKSETYRGGYGGYSAGIKYLEAGTILYINVGGKGTDAPAKATKYTGGYNGGGTGSGTDTYMAAGGGGATHIAIASGLLSSLSENKDKILIVAGGGGGAGLYSTTYYGYGGHGGGTIGTAGSTSDTESGSGAGGTQTTGSAFGKGASPSAGSGGGAGLYGGYGAAERGGGGGSGYVEGLISPETYSYDGAVSEDAARYTAKQGDGYAKITYVSETYKNPTLASAGDTLTFENPTHYEVDITVSGYYQLEAWGGQGGFASTSTYRGGYGSYSAGVAYLEAGTKLHVYVGGKGQNVYYNNESANGGFNGGGAARGAKTYRSAGGGGATHIATESGLLSELSEKKDKVLIVAGGGGGAGYYSSKYYGNGGEAGGFKGNAGKTSDTMAAGVGATQTTGNAFGQGASPTNGTGGGGGLYGGKAGTERGAGGGSGYIGNDSLISTETLTKRMVCYECAETTDESTKTVSVDTVSAVATKDTTKIGDGYAKITFLYVEEPVLTIGKDETKEFAFTGGYQRIKIGVSGYYKLETWGAQGGYAYTEKYRGGYGGYSKGIKYLKEGTILYIYVGGKGTDAPTKAIQYMGGFNGGGTGTGTDTYRAAGGGGATHIATMNGLLSSLSENKDKILIVAGGGGGAGLYSTSLYGYGGHGGGTIGTAGSTSDTESGSGAGGTQTTGSAFGKGASPSAGSGGGAGLYGGYGAAERGGGGGSGYVEGLISPETYSYDGAVSVDAASYTAKQGDGYAKITYVSETYKNPTLASAGDTLTFEKPTHYEVDITVSGYYQLEAWGGQGGFANTSTYRGGYGSYSAGVAYLEAGTKLHVYVGGKGQNVYYNNESANGGYNGGGTSRGAIPYRAAGGGGATHIATESGLLSELSEKKDKVLIVAGGGGGGAYLNGDNSGAGGDAGGYIGDAGAKKGDGTAGTGGTQTTGYAFGQGASPTNGTGGGGGFYGGKAGTYAGAGAGSGYIGNESLISTETLTKRMVCYGCAETTDESTKTVSVNVVSAVATADTTKIGDGYAKITFLYIEEPILTIGKDETKEFAFTGTYKKLEIKNSGYYKLETWGAQGGYASSATYRGGYGGYSTGLKYLDAGTVLYVYVGGKGIDAPTKAIQYMGGYNGGGSGKGGDAYRAAGGGGATHIATQKGLLNDLAENQDKVLIVAGGGGGAAYYDSTNYGKGGDGGGYIGSAGEVYGSGTGGIGGTQTAGYAFGQGASPGTGTGGGGGFYGGNAGTYEGAGGGSGYVTGLIEGETYGYDAAVSDTATSYAAKIGDGYAKVTYVGTTYKHSTLATAGSSVTFDKPTHYEVEVTKTGYYQLEAWGGQGGYGHSTSYRGGYGSYSTGIAYLEAGTKLHVYVGGKGQNGHYRGTSANGGFNGGGNSRGGTNAYRAGAGGGATHIATVSGLLSTLSESKDNILIVAGGGGGGAYYDSSSSGKGGEAGGYTGNKGAIKGSGSAGTGGTQTAGGGFGLGASPGTGTGGGGGFYGGKNGTYAGAGGGSGYIANSLLVSSSSITKHMTCYSCTTSTAESTYTTSVTTVSATPTADTPKEGNGYAKITLLQLATSVAESAGSKKITALANDATTAASNGLVSANGIRYAGPNSGVKNNIWFNCKDEVNGKKYGESGYEYNSTNCELWRIIGVFDTKTSKSDIMGSPRIKIVRDSILSSTMPWDSSANDTYVNQWGETTLSDGVTAYAGSSLMQYLKNTYYPSLSTEAKAEMSQAVWYTGAVADGTAATVYASERSDSKGTSTSVKYTTVWEGLVGLIYTSDFGYAGTNCGNNTIYGYQNSSSCGKTSNWLTPSSGLHWTITPFYGRADDAWDLSSDGYASDADGAYRSEGVRPTVYLKPEVEIIKGDGSTGTITNGDTGPYVLGRMSS